MKKVAKDKSVSVRLTDADFKTLKKHADSLGVPHSFLIRYAVRRMLNDRSIPENPDVFVAGGSQPDQVA